MTWLRQGRKVEALEAAIRKNSAHRSMLQQRLASRVRSRLQQPGALAWAFAAGSLAGLVGASASSGSAAASKSSNRFKGSHFSRPQAVVSSLRYLNVLLIGWNVLSGLKHEQPLDP